MNRERRRCTQYLTRLGHTVTSLTSPPARNSNINIHVSYDKPTMQTLHENRFNRPMAKKPVRLCTSASCGCRQGQHWRRRRFLCVSCTQQHTCAVEQCKWKPKLLTERRPKLKTYNEENIETLGMCIATVNPMGKKHRLQFVVVPKGRQSLIGASDWAW